MEAPGTSFISTLSPQVQDRVARAQAAIANQPEPAPEPVDPRPPFTPPATAEEAKGNTLLMVERNGYDDSDFSGLFYDPASGRFGWAVTGSTAYGGGFIPHADASEEIVSQYRAEYETARAAMEAKRDAWFARVPDKGKEVLVSGASKKHAGIKGTVFWYGRDDYHSTQRSDRYRVGVQSEGGDKFFIPAAQALVKVDGEYVEPEGTSKTTGYDGTTGMMGGDVIAYGFSMQWPDPDRVESASKRGRREHERTAS